MLTLLRSVPVSLLGAPARHPPIRGASSGPSLRRSAPGFASAPRASRADERRTPARGPWVASRSRGARPRANGERCPAARGARAGPAVPGRLHHHGSKPAANRLRRRRGSLPGVYPVPAGSRRRIPPAEVGAPRRQVSPWSDGTSSSSTTDKHVATMPSGRRRCCSNSGCSPYGLATSTRPLAVVAAETGPRGPDTHTGGRSPQKVQDTLTIYRLRLAACHARSASTNAPHSDTCIQTRDPPRSTIALPAAGFRL